MQQFRQKAFLVDKAKSGSVILEGSAALVALWLLKTTIGETVKEAWKESELHKKLKGYLNESMPRKIAMLADRLRHLHHKYYHHRWDLELKVDMEVASDDVGITIYVQSRGEELPPSKLEFSDEHPQGKPEEKKKSREA